MKLGIGSYTFAWAIGVPGYPPTRPFGALDLLEVAEQAGTRVVQVCDNLPLTGLRGCELDAFEERARGAGIAIELGMRGLGPEEVRAHLALARRLGSPFLRVVVDRRDDHPSPEEVIARVRALLPEFDRAGVALAIENHDRFPARVLERIVEQTSPALVGICLDTVNSFGALEGPEVVVRTLARHVLSLHVKDFSIERVPSMMGFSITGAPVGEGRLDIGWLLAEIQSGGRDCNAIIETWPPLGPTLDETIARERVWAERSVRHLRAWIKE